MTRRNSLTQKEMITRDLLEGKVITPMYALENYGCYRLAARIHELRNDDNMPISSTIHANDNHYAHYKLEEGPAYAVCR